MATPWVSLLNDAQKQAVESLSGPHLVLAGAGTGKTRVLEYRTLELIEKGVDPASILLLTFTRRAAAEMLARTSRHDIRSKRVAGGTFHSFALMILKRESRLVGFESFNVLDRGDAEDLVGKVIQNLHLREKNFPKKSTVTDIISKSVNKEISIGDLLEKDYPHLSEWEKALDLVKIRYIREKAALQVMDYDDLLFFLAQLLEKIESVRRRLNETYQYVMVDEYQDTNKLQSRIVAHLAAHHGNVLIVGDEMQSIYGFRGANFANMLDFPHTFPKTKQITLVQNYRSTQEILDVANCVLDEVTGPHFKKYLQSPRHGQKPVYYQCNSPRQEAAYVAKEIVSLSHTGIPLRHIAVLFRAAYQSAPLELELTSLGIPFKKFGGIRFVETSHVKDALSHLRVILNPKDELSWRRILMLLDGIGEKGADALVAKIVAVGYRTALTTPVTEDLRTLILLLENKQTTPAEKLNHVLIYYKPILRVTYDDYPTREQDLSALVDIATSYTTISDMLDDFALEPPDKSATATYAQNPDSDWVCLSTIHSAKGLEWDTVFAIGVSEGKFPVIRTTSDDEDIEEERRLFYVAVTRPKQRLFITASLSGGRGAYYSSWNSSPRPSRFVEPLVEKELVEAHGVIKTSAFDDTSDEVEYDPMTASFRPKRFPKKNLYEKLIDEF